MGKYLDSAVEGAASLPSTVGGLPAPLRLRHGDGPHKGKVLLIAPHAPQEVTKEFRGEQRTQYAMVVVVIRGKAYTRASEDDDVELESIKKPRAMTLYLSPTAAVEWREMFQAFKPKNGKLPGIVAEARANRGPYETGAIFTIDPKNNYTDGDVDKLLAESSGELFDPDDDDDDVPI